MTSPGIFESPQDSERRLSCAIVSSIARPNLALTEHVEASQGTMSFMTVTVPGAEHHRLIVGHQRTYAVLPILMAHVHIPACHLRAARKLRQSRRAGSSGHRPAARHEATGSKRPPTHVGCRILK